MNKKEDQRTKLTRMLLQNALLELLMQKPIQAVTVKELCEKAGVNRGTFYLHYLDIYDLLEKMENALLLQLQEILEKNPVLDEAAPSAATESFTSALFLFFENNREMCAILLGENGDKKFVEKIIGLGREKSLQEYTGLYPAATPEQTDLFYAFVANGFLGLLQYGLKNGIPLDALVAGAGRLIAASVHYFDAATAF